jgi:hypothetical protein
MGFDISYVLSVAYSHTAGGDAPVVGASLSDMFGAVKVARCGLIWNSALDAYQEIEHAVRR